MIVEIYKNDKTSLFVDCEISQGSEANLCGHPDSWTPSSSDEVEIFGIEMFRNEKIKKLCKKLVDKLSINSDLKKSILEEVL